MPNFGKRSRGVASYAEGFRKQVRGLRFKKYSKSPLIRTRSSRQCVMRLIRTDRYLQGMFLMEVLSARRQKLLEIDKV